MSGVGYNQLHRCARDQIIRECMLSIMVSQIFNTSCGIQAFREPVLKNGLVSAKYVQRMYQVDILTS